MGAPPPTPLPIIARPEFLLVRKHDRERDVGREHAPCIVTAIGYGDDARDVARIHVLAMTAAAVAGEPFIAAGRFFWIADVARVLREHFPAYRRKLPKFGLPDTVVRIAARFDPVVKGQLYELGKRREVSASKAKQVLGWTTRAEE